MSWTLLAFAAMNFAAALSGATFKPDQWFRDLNKPSWQPPDWAFPLVWSVLYAINAFSGWIVWKQVGLEGPGLWAMGIYVVGLILNASWSYVFFGLKRLDWAKTSAGLLCLGVALQIIVFLPISQLAGLILLPYLAWVMVATVLSATVWRMNPDQSAA
ncbi:MAG: TspO/MBR family protein [Pseudomonadota bacterium]